MIFIFIFFGSLELAVGHWSIGVFALGGVIGCRVPSSNSKLLNNVSTFLILGIYYVQSKSGYNCPIV